MARNDIVLLDSIVNKARTQFGEQRDESEVFELFCFDQVLKDIELSYEELESGWTDGPDDGGIDGFFLLVDGIYITDPDSIPMSYRNPEIRVELFTVNRSDSFKQKPLNALISSLAEILDLTKSDADLIYPFREEVLAQREVFRKIFVSLADRRPRLVVSINYCCRGDSQNLAPNLLSRADQLKKLIKSLFSQVEISANFLGATELLHLARRQRTYSLRLPFIESYISRSGDNYVVLVPLSKYYRFVTDETGMLRRYLFESNVRDYLGEGNINRDIRETLAGKAPSAVEDFWWLNNGVTILAAHATVVGKELSLENVQIVNGLQTTETIYHYFTDEKIVEDDDRAILVKILLSADESVRARIIKATNYQSPVELSSLRGLDKIQRDIEHFLFDHGWFYDRRKNYYKNQGRPSDRVVSIPYLAAAVRAVALRDPARSQRQRSRSLRDDDIYQQVFNPNWDLNVYLASLEITNAVETVLQTRRFLSNIPPIALVHYVAYIYTCKELHSCVYEPDDVAQLAGKPPDRDTVNNIRGDLVIESKKLPQKHKLYQGILLSKDFIDKYVQTHCGN